MDTTRMKLRRIPEPVKAKREALENLDQVLRLLVQANDYLHETGNVDSEILDIAMNDLNNCVRRCRAYVRDNQEG